jgi:hypothetical protein
MKKLTFALFACLALSHHAHAAVAPLYESVLEYEAITYGIGTNHHFQDIINPSEVIITIKRMTQQVNTIGEVDYEIVTGRPLTSEESAELQTKTYIAKLNVGRNPGIGRKLITLVSITPTSK